MSLVVADLVRQIHDARLEVDAAWHAYANSTEYDPRVNDPFADVPVTPLFRAWADALGREHDLQSRKSLWVRQARQEKERDAEPYPTTGDYARLVGLPL